MKTVQTTTAVEGASCAPSPGSAPGITTRAHLRLKGWREVSEAEQKSTPHKMHCGHRTRKVLVRTYVRGYGKNGVVPRWRCKYCGGFGPRLVPTVGSATSRRAYDFMSTKTDHAADRSLHPIVGPLVIEQPYSITGDVWFFHRFTGHFGAIGGVHLTRAEVLARCEQKAGPGELRMEDGRWVYWPNAKLCDSRDARSQEGPTP